MTVTHTLLTEGSSETNGTSFNTASISPSANKLLIVDIAGEANASGDNVQPTLSGCGVTWVAVASLVGVGNDGPNYSRQTMFRALGTPTTGVLTISFSATQTACMWSVCEKGNIDTGGTNGSTAVVQSATGTSTTATCTVTLATFGNVNNATHGAFHREGGSTGVTQSPGTGFTEQTETEVDLTGGFYAYQHTIYRSDNDTTVDSTASDALDGTTGIAIEIKESSGVTLTVADCTHSVAVDSPALTQANTLVVQDTAQSVAADNVALVQQNTLIVADALHSVLANNILLELATVLIVDDALHAVAVDSPSLIQANTLVVADALHSVAVDNIALDFSISLIVSDATHSVAADSPALTQANILAIQNALHSVALDNVNITQANTLVVADALHSNIVDNILLSIPSSAITPLERIFLIPGEDRTFIIASEDRTFIIASEDRSFLVEAEDRTFKVTR